MICKRYSKEELEFVGNNYKTIGNNEIAKTLGRTPYSIPYILKKYFQKRDKNIIKSIASRNFSGNNNPMFGKKHNIKTIEKLKSIPKQYSQIRKGVETRHIRGSYNQEYKVGKSLDDIYGKDKASQIREHISQGVKKSFSKQEIKSKLSFIRKKSISEGRLKTVFVQGKLNPSYVHGMAYKPYNREFDYKRKELIRCRDHKTCQICGRHEMLLRRRLAVHHIDYDKENCKYNNLISLCSNCHIKTNMNRLFWREMLSRKILQINDDRKRIFSLFLSKLMQDGELYFSELINEKALSTNQD